MSSGATTEPRPPTLVIGLGNPILGDDGVGWRVVDALERRLVRARLDRLAAGEVELDHLAVGGLRLMERLVGYDRVVLVDAVLASDRPGTITTAPLAEIVSRLHGHLDSAHDATLVEAISAGRALGAHLPDEVTVVGVAVERVDEFGERLSPAVTAAVAPAVEAILAVLVVLRPSLQAI